MDLPVRAPGQGIDSMTSEAFEAGRPLYGKFGVIPVKK